MHQNNFLNLEHTYKMHTVLQLTCKSSFPPKSTCILPLTLLKAKFSEVRQVKILKKLMSKAKDTKKRIYLSKKWF